jgi:hypothetical protein
LIKSESRKLLTTEQAAKTEKELRSKSWDTERVSNLGEADDTARRLSDYEQSSSGHESEDEEPPLSYKQTCKSHFGQLVLAYNKRTNEYLCTKCIEKQQLKADCYQVYPQVVQHVKEKIQAAKIMIKFRKT